MIARVNKKSSRGNEQQANQKKESKLEGSFLVRDLFGSCIIHEPMQRSGPSRSNARARQALLRLIEYCLQRVLLPSTRRNKHHSRRMVDDGESERNAARRGLGAVFNRNHPPGRLAQKGMPGEERRGVSVRSHTKQNNVEDGETCGIFGRKRLNELGFILIRELVDVSEERGVDTMNIGVRNRDFGQELVVDKFVVGFWVIEWDSTLVRKVDMPDRLSRQTGTCVRICQNKALETHDMENIHTTCPILPRNDRRAQKAAWARTRH